MSQLNNIQRGIVCPYCGKPTTYMDSAPIYNGKSYGMVYACLPCDAWVGVHKGSSIALGRLANHTLRQLKKEAHKYFDYLWQAKQATGVNKVTARNLAYAWLAGKMELSIELAHIGMFDEDQCLQVINICKPYYDLISVSKTHEKA